LNIIFIKDSLNSSKNILAIAPTTLT